MTWSLSSCVDLESSEARVRAAGVSEDPLVTDGLVLWLDASDATSLTVDGSNKVSQWRDKSGNGNHAGQATGVNQATLTPNSLNSLPSIVFDGVDDYFRIEDHATLRPDEITVFVVGKATAYTTYAATFLNKSTDYAFWNDGYGLNVMEDPFQDQFQFWVSDYYPINDYQNHVRVPYGQYHLWAGSYGNDLSSFWIDGDLAATETTLSGAIVHSSRAMTLGMSYLGTTEVALADPLNGEMAEVLIYNRALSDAEREQVERYILSKWGV